MSYLPGLHDPGGEHLMQDAPGTIVHAISLKDSQSYDWSDLAEKGFKVVCRLNWGWSPDGTIPQSSQYGEMASRSAKFVSNSKGCYIYIIGNEFNISSERPNGQPITPQDAANCHIQCYKTLKNVNPQIQIWLASIAPWNNESGDWLQFLRTLSHLVGDYTDGYALHAYTHGTDPNLVFSDEKRHGWYWHLRTYRDQIDAILHGNPQAKTKRFGITESDQDEAWANVNSGWIKNATIEINNSNKENKYPEIDFICFYRWINYPHDKWGMEHKSGVLDDFVSAVNLRFTSSSLETHLPIVSGGQGGQVGEEPDLPDRQWDPRLTSRGVTVESPKLNSGDEYWFAFNCYWLDEQQSQGRHHIYGNVYENGKNTAGKRLKVSTDRESFPVVTEDKSKDYPPFNFWYNYPMYSGFNGYSIRMDDGLPSEIVKGIGIGTNGNASTHTCTVVEWRKEKYKGSSSDQGRDGWVYAPAGANIRDYPKTGNILIAVPFGEQISVYEEKIVDGESWKAVQYKRYKGWMLGTLITYHKPENPAYPDPSPLPPMPSPDQYWTLSREFVRRWEGGFQNVENDSGNWTGCAVNVGILKGTKYGISACSYPHLDIVNLTMEQADQIYFTDYWQKSGADKLSWPGCLVVFDTAVLHGVETAKQWMEEVGANPFMFSARRLALYPTLSNWNYWGKAWVLRVSELLEACATQ